VPGDEENETRRQQLFMRQAVAFFLDLDESRQ
jgi:hypothetical protein